MNIKYQLLSARVGQVSQATVIFATLLLESGDQVAKEIFVPNSPKEIERLYGGPVPYLWKRWDGACASVAN